LEESCEREHGKNVIILLRKQERSYKIIVEETNFWLLVEK